MNFLGIFFIWNIIIMLTYGIDKYCAIKNIRRIKENTLLILSFLFGGFGAALGMIVFNHKTRHSKFRIIVPLAMIEAITVLFLILGKLWGV